MEPAISQRWAVLNSPNLHLHGPRPPAHARFSQKGCFHLSALLLRIFQTSPDSSALPRGQGVRERMSLFTASPSSSFHFAALARRCFHHQTSTRTSIDCGPLIRLARCIAYAFQSSSPQIHTVSLCFLDHLALWYSDWDPTDVIGYMTGQWKSFHFLQQASRPRSK
jgi:hypothetical protein